MAPQEVLDEFFRYVQNEIPLRLIFIPDMKPVDRFFVQEHYLPRITAITEEDVDEKVSNTADGEIATRELVQEVVQYAILSHRWLPQGDLPSKTWWTAPLLDLGVKSFRSFARLPTTTAAYALLRQTHVVSTRRAPPSLTSPFA